MIGAWNIEPLDDPQKMSSVSYRKSGTQKVDACGWYCYITPTKLYKEAHYRQISESMGPCEVYTWDQRIAGYEALIDWEIPCEHLQEYGQSLIPNENNATVEWNKSGNDWTMINPPIKVMLENRA
jgi:hypothetical protein